MKKRSWIFYMGVMAALSLTACDGAAKGENLKEEKTSEAAAIAETAAETTAASPETTAISSETAATQPETAASEAETGKGEANALDGEILPVEQASRWDLDQDGTPETVNFNIPVNGDWYEVTVEDGEGTAPAAKAEEEGWSLTGEVFVTSLDGETLQLLVPERGPSDDPQVYIWGYREKTLQKIGSVCSYVDQMTIRDGILTCREQSRILQSVDVETAYQMVNDTLQEVPLDFYAMGNTVTALREIPTCSEKEGTEDGPVIPANHKVIILGTDNQSWVKLQDEETGETGWIHLLDGYYTVELGGEEVKVHDCLEGIILAG